MSGAPDAPDKKIKPIVTVITPGDGARYDPGETISLNVAAAASANVARIELSLDGAIVATQVNPNPSATFSTRIAFTPARQGRILLTLVAVDGTGVSSEPFSFALIVGDEATPTPESTPTTSTTPTTPTTTALEPAGIVGPGGCALGATFIQDVNVPDGTVIRPGAKFTKTWRMKNSSNCDWDTGYELAYFSNTEFGDATSVPVPTTPKDGLVDISVPLVAPGQPGVYTSTWRLKDPAGQSFGDLVYVVITVP